MELKMVFRIQWLVIGAASEHDKEGFPALGVGCLRTSTQIQKSYGSARVAPLAPSK